MLTEKSCLNLNYDPNKVNKIKKEIDDILDGLGATLD